jgi:signal transduction histidine kinase
LEQIKMAADRIRSRLEAVEGELSEFAYIVSHDLAASFRHMKAFSELLQQDSTGFTPEQNSYCAHIQAAADKCTGMLEQLLILSRIQRVPMEMGECDFATLLDTVRLQLSGQIRRSGAQIVSGDVGQVRVDGDLFTRALGCLLDNAVKFRRDSTRPRIAIAMTQDNETKRIVIADNGTGLPPVDPERLFWMFYRGDPEKYAGTGTGLTIARRILRRHTGEVRFLDVPEGACVEISLPLAGCAQ